MFVTVKYGDDQSNIFNINCRNETLLHHIKKRCKMDRDEIVELSDELGVVKNLRHNLNEYGTDYLKERETLILLRVDSGMSEDDTDSSSDKIIFIPMLTAMLQNQDFTDTLNPREENIHESKLSLIDLEDGKGKRRGKDKKREKKPKPRK